jgi:ferrochelatase
MNSSRPGVIIAQLGTPDAPTAPALRRYLRQFLWDPRVIEINRIKWWLILNLFVLPRRPAQSAALYKRVWTEKGSPLLLTSLEQARALEAALGGSVLVEVGMRYGNPSLPSALDRLCEKGADRILIFSMFPQYAAATTASIYDAVGAHFRRRRVVPALRFVPPYGKHPAYIGALAAIVREELSRLSWKPDKLLISFHGIPKSYVEKGDIYKLQAEETTRLLASALGLTPADYELCFQSRFGREEWLKPYTDEKLGELGRGGVKRVVAICPGFTADCLETIDEIGREGKRQFLEAGGSDLRLIPCLNTHPLWIKAMETMAREELSGWLKGPC